MTTNGHETRRYRLSRPLMDGPRRYGWVSIGLHWLAAVAVISMWILGQSIATSGDATAARNLHVSIGLTLWIVLALRITWRLRSGHPHARGLGPRIFRFARATHYLMLLLIAIMLLSGPLLAWSSGLPIDVFGRFLLFDDGFPAPALQLLASKLHAGAAAALAVLIALHVAGAFKHLMFHEDETFVAMLWPGRGDDEA